MPRRLVIGKRLKERQRIRKNSDGKEITTIDREISTGIFYEDRRSARKCKT